MNWETEYRINKTVAQRIRKLRAIKDITQAQLAEKCDVSPQTIKKIESGQHACLITTLVKVSHFLGVSCDYIVGNTEISRKSRVSSILSTFNEDDLELLETFLDKYRDLFSQVKEGNYNNEDKDSDLR